MKKLMYSEGALDIGYKTGFFLAEPLSTSYKPNARKATIKELDHIPHLEKQLGHKLSWTSMMKPCPDHTMMLCAVETKPSRFIRHAWNQ
jgi:hypothetical protein